MTVADLVNFTNELHYLNSLHPEKYFAGKDYNETAVKSTVIASYYRFMSSANLAEFNHVVLTLKIDPNCIKFRLFKVHVRRKLERLLKRALLSPRRFRPLFIRYFAPTINKWV